MTKIKELKQENIYKIRHCFYRGGVWTKNLLSQETGLSLAGTTNILQALEAENEIEFIGNAASTGGRKSKRYQLREDYAHIGTVILSHHSSLYKMQTNSFSLHSECVYESIVESPTGTVAEIRDQVQQLVVKDPLMKVLVISFPGIIGENGEILSSDFKMITNENLIQSLSTVTDIPILLENAVNAASLAYSKAHPNYGTLALLYQPDKDFAGSGMVINGQLHRGKHGFAGEVGYLERGVEMLASNTPSRDFKQLLLSQITAISSVVAPDLIAYYCPTLEEDIQMKETGIPEPFQPKLIRMMEIDSLILKGVQAIGKQKILETVR